MTEDLPQRSPLAQRLYQRSLESAGVINLRPSSIDRTQATIHRMVQRELLPSQIESHYQTAGVKSSLELPRRARVETLDRVAPSLETSLLSPLLQRSPASMSSDPIAPLPSWNTAPAATISLPSSTTLNTFRVSRKPTSASIAIPAINNSTTAQASTIATVPESTMDRVPHPDTLSQGHRAETSLVMTKPSMPNSLDPTPPTDPHPASDRLSPQIDAPSVHSGDRLAPAVSSLSSGGDASTNPLPLLARFPVTKSTSTSADLGKSLATGDIQRVLVASSGILPSPTVPMNITPNSQPLVIAKFPVTRRSSGEQPLLQTQRLTSVAAPAVMIPSVQQTTVMIQPLAQRQFESEGSSIVRRQNMAESLAQTPVTGIDRSRNVGAAKLPLPLHTQVPVETIVRQTAAMGASISVPTTAIPPPPPPAERATSEAEPDLKKLTDRVSSLLTRQLVIERERRGIERW
jgi:hypothetical protein